MLTSFPTSLHIQWYNHKIVIQLNELQNKGRNDERQTAEDRQSIDAIDTALENLRLTLKPSHNLWPFNLMGWAGLARPKCPPRASQTHMRWKGIVCSLLFATVAISEFIIYHTWGLQIHWKSKRRKQKIKAERQQKKNRIMA